MFTGIVEELGTVAEIDGQRVRFEAAVVLADATLGASIAVNGCCLTVVEFGSNTGGAGAGSSNDVGWFDAELSAETLNRTTLGSLHVGDRVNLERPVRMSDRLGGHIVQGHVDTVGKVEVAAPDMAVSFDPELSRYVVEKGSITIDGVSLTVCDNEPGWVSFALIPHTCDVTTLGNRIVGSDVNVEVDVGAKHIERLLEAHLQKIEG